MNKIIPKPVKVTQRKGKFILDKDTAIFCDSKCEKLAKLFKEMVEKLLSFEIPIFNIESNEDFPSMIILQLSDELNSSKDESYLLNIEKSKIMILASNPVGIFYAIQSLRQLIFNRNEIKDSNMNAISVRSMEIEDYPRFEWRGFMLDESRHFFGKEIVKKILNEIAYLKINKFHWHLTDDQGWRIEIKKYPKLNEVGSKRKGTRKSRRIGSDGIPVSGFYTQEELREIVEYARERFIEVIPEIDVPGHTTSALASYPELSCTGGKFKVRQSFGIFKDVLCVGKEKVFEFVEDVFKEVSSVFTSEYFHFGGDEVPTKRWKKCPDCQERMKEHGFQDERELQIYFTNRISQYLNSLEKIPIGWNEILNDKLTNIAVCQYWNDNFDLVLKHARNGRKIIMSEAETVYLNYPYKATPLQQTYFYDPVPSELEKNYHDNILGIEACLWTEYIANDDRLEYQLYPRILAIAEIGWTPKINKNFNDFKKRLKSYYEWFAVSKINAASFGEATNQN
ncbi:MAG: family 20 glycosylhydrolase [Candidatus Lokiarchaeota archaeon]|nr:family 20 glycosylhydrolase [Candidatus Lokiarchaeota archaeon]MBD3343377.1 family 20 glycosylhydrolase [Candidatus Lokiarchaeota archaeon]